MIYDYATLEKMLGVPRKRFSDLALRYHIPKIMVKKRPHIDDSGVEEIKKHLSKFNPGCKRGTYTRLPVKKKVYWKVSVFDKKADSFIVKSVCLGEEEAKELCHELDKAGIIARASKHKKSAYYYA